jgi:hypothetical protein
MSLSPHRRAEIIDALRRGTVPRVGLDAFAVGMDRFTASLDQELDAVALGRGGFKAVRGDYGSGKTFFGRWLQERARAKGFVTSEVQISETETPLHRMETVYRRLCERLATADTRERALRHIIDSWFFTIEEDVLAEGKIEPTDAQSLSSRTESEMEKRLANVTRVAPAFSAALRTYRRALASGHNALAEGLIAWIGGQPNVAASVKREAGIKGEIDHFGAASFLSGLLIIMKDCGFRGLVVVLDEVETLQRMRSDTRERGLNALRQIIDEIDAGHFPSLYLIITGTPSFFDGPQGIQRLPPLAQRLHVDFATEARFDNPRAVQVRLPGFDLESLCRVGHNLCEIYSEQATDADHLRKVVDDSYVADLAKAITGALGGKVGIAPRIFLKKLVGDILDRVDQFSDFDPRKHYALTVNDTELTTIERASRAATSVDDVELQL